MPPELAQASALPTVAPAPVNPVSLPVVAPTAAVQPSIPLIDMSNPAVAALVEAARSEEKTKLYTEQQSLKDQLAELRAQLNGKLTPDEQLAARFQEVSSQLTDVTNQLTAMRQEREKEREAERQARETERAASAARERQSALQAYLDRRYREEIQKGTKMLPEFLGGSSEAEIEQSIVLATSEFARLRDVMRAELQAEIPTPPPPPVLPVAVSVVNPPPGPSAFPTVANPAAIPSADPGTAGFTAQVAELTTPEAVRSGAYAKQRQALLAGVRQGVVPPAGVPFANTPRAHIPVQQHGVVMQPQGLPTPPVANPHVQAVPPQPLPLAPTAPAPSPVPTVPSPAEFRAAAIAAANRGLANPAANRAAVRGPQPVSHPEYQLQPTVTPVTFDAGHPMERNS